MKVFPCHDDTEVEFDLPDFESGRMTDPIKQAHDELKKREQYWRNWNRRVSNHAAKLNAEIEQLHLQIGELHEENEKILAESMTTKEERDEWKRRCRNTLNWIYEYSPKLYTISISEIDGAAEWFTDPDPDPDPEK